MDDTSVKLFLGIFGKIANLVQLGFAFGRVEALDGATKELFVVGKARSLGDSVIVLDAKGWLEWAKIMLGGLTLPVKRPDASALQTVVLMPYFSYRGLKGFSIKISR